MAGVKSFRRPRRDRNGGHRYVADADRYNEAADFAETGKTTEASAHRFPVIERDLSRGGYAAPYDETPDHQPVLGPVLEVAAASAWTVAGAVTASRTRR